MLLDFLQQLLLSWLTDLRITACASVVCLVHVSVVLAAAVTREDATPLCRLNHEMLCDKSLDWKIRSLVNYFTTRACVLT